MLKPCFIYLILILLSLSLNAQNLVPDDLFGNDGGNGAALNDLGLSVEETDGIAKTPDNKFVVAVTSYAIGPAEYAEPDYLIRFKENGVVDSTFGSNGVVNYSLAEMRYVGIIVDSNNNVIVAATVEDSYSFLLKFDAFGNLVTGFGVNGKLNLDILAHNVILQPDGKYVVVGMDATLYKAAIQRINPDGSSDNSFGDGGKMIMIHYAEFLNAKVDNENRIVAVGDIFENLFLARVLPDGERDSTFSADGFVNYSREYLYYQGNSISIQPDGKIVVAGAVHRAFYGQQWEIWRYTEDGTLDLSFGENGLVDSLWPINGYGYANSVLALEDSTLLIGGTYFDEYSFHQVLVKLKSNGTVDSSYGTNGMVKLNLDGLAPLFLKQLANDSLVLSTSRFAKPDFIPTLLKFDSQGNMVTSFGMNGIAGQKAGYFDSNDGILSVALLSNGKMLAIDQFIATVDNKAPIVRYKQNGLIDSSFGINGLLFLDKTSVLGYNGSFIQGDSALYCVLNGGDGLGDDSLLFNIYKFNSDGTIDSSYGTEGTGRASPYIQGHDIASFNDALVQEDNKIVFMGTTGPPDYDIRLFRLLPDSRIDSSFGFNGYFQFNIFDKDQPYKIIQQSNGKFILISNHFDGDGDDPWVVTRIDSNGASIDSSFGINGEFQFVQTLFTTYHLFESPVLLRYSDDKILVTETSGDFTNGYGSLRLTPNGVLDSTFHADGANYNPDYNDEINFYQMLPGGRILGCGYDNNLNLLFIQFKSDLSIDSSFGTNGSEIFSPVFSFQRIYAMRLLPDSSVCLAGKVGDYSNSDELLMHFIYQDIPLGESNVRDNQTFVFPNPSSTSIKIYYKLPPGITQATLTIYDLNGTALKQFRLSNSLAYTTVRTSDLPEGTYTYEIQTSQELIKGRKFVVIH